MDATGHAARIGQALKCMDRYKDALTDYLG